MAHNRWPFPPFALLIRETWHRVGAAITIIRRSCINPKFAGLRSPVQALGSKRVPETVRPMDSP